MKQYKSFEAFIDEKLLILADHDYLGDRWATRHDLDLDAEEYIDLCMQLTEKSVVYRDAFSIIDTKLSVCQIFLALLPNSPEPKLLDLLSDVKDKLLISKAVEYATESDRFHNFKTAARIWFSNDGVSPAEYILRIYCLKHIVSVHDMVNGHRHVGPTPVLIEKFGDILAYMLLHEWGLLTGELS